MVLVLRTAAACFVRCGLLESLAKLCLLLLLRASGAVGLCLFGFLGAWLGGANVFRGGLRVIVGGWLALGIVYGIGRALNVDSTG